MMAGKVDFYSGETLEAILAAMEDNLFEQDEDITAQIDEVVEAMEENQPVCRFSCDQCDKICKTQRGLRRHKSTKHVELPGKMDLFLPKRIKQLLNPSSILYILKHMLKKVYQN